MNNIMKIKGEYLVRWLVQTMDQNQGLIDALDYLSNCHVVIMNYRQTDGNSATGFMTLPMGDFKILERMEKMIMKGIEEGKTMDQINADFDRFTKENSNDDD